MRPDPKPFYGKLENLYLYYCERKWLLQTKKKQDMRKVRIISNIFRFIDGLCTFNNDEFESNYNDI